MGDQVDVIVSLKRTTVTISTLEGTSRVEKVMILNSSALEVFAPDVKR